MACSKSSAPLAFFHVVSVLFFALVIACGSCPSPKPKPTPTPSTSSQGTCPRVVLKLVVCADVLGCMLNVTIGASPVTPCCSLLQGLVDLEAAVCLRTSIRANILGINLNIWPSLSLHLNVHGKVPPGFQCA